MTPKNMTQMTTKWQNNDKKRQPNGKKMTKQCHRKIGITNNDKTKRQKNDKTKRKKHDQKHDKTKYSTTLRVCW